MQIRNPDYEKIIHYNRLMWMQKIAAMPINRYPRIFLNIWVPSNRPVGRLHLTTRQSFLNSLHYCNSEGIMKYKCSNGKLNEWVKKAANHTDWTELPDKLRGVRILNEVEFYKTYYNQCTLIIIMVVKKQKFNFFTNEKSISANHTEK